MKFATCRLILIAAVGASTPAWAGTDNQIWTTGSATVKLSDKWRFSEELVGRFSSNREGLYEIEATSLVGYRITKNITLWGGYVHNPQYSGGDFTVMERRAREQVTFDNVAKIGSGKLNARMRLEQRWREHVDGTGWRLRPYLKYSTPLMGKAALNLSTEPFFNLNTTSFQRQSGLERVRNLVSISAPISKRVNGEFGYLNQHGFVRHGEDTSDNVAYAALSLSL